MSGMWGSKYRLSLFGESHGEGIGVVIDGIEPGIVIDMEEIYKEMARRAPGRDKLSTTRKEADRPEILSGVFEGRTTGAPLAMVIRNTDKRSKDYSKTKDLARPGHADFTGHMRYQGFNDYRGGGHFSGRITAPLVFAGAVAKQVLQQKGILVGAHIKQVHQVKDESFDALKLDAKCFETLLERELPVLNKACITPMKDAINEARMACDSVGGIIECGIIGVKAGKGDPFFDSVESRIAHLAFSVPAVKGIEFGQGFDFANVKGSEANDPYTIQDGEVRTLTNHNGGILGGITNGMPILFSVAIKPTPSISQEQQTINMKTLENATLKVEGRHDPCIVQRAVVVIEAIAAIAVLDML
ncbi:MAG: chorismate synthase [Cellulosilyticaceae bacterium]